MYLLKRVAPGPRGGGVVSSDDFDRALDGITEDELPKQGVEGRLRQALRSAESIAAVWSFGVVQVEGRLDRLGVVG